MTQPFKSHRWRTQILVVLNILCFTSFTVALIMFLLLAFKADCYNIGKNMDRAVQWNTIGGCSVQSNNNGFIPTEFINIDITR